jgi:hypothetical protein
VGTTIAENRRCAAAASGSVSQNTVVNAARFAPVVNHLWALTTHSSPSSRADDCMSVGSEPATSGLGQPDRGEDLALHHGVEPAPLLRVGAVACAA